MKHKITDDVNVKVNVEFDKEDVIDVVDKVQTAVITVVIVTTIAHVFKAVFK